LSLTDRGGGGGGGETTNFFVGGGLVGGGGGGGGGGAVAEPRIFVYGCVSMRKGVGKCGVGFFCLLVGALSGKVSGVF